MKTRAIFFERINKIDKPLARIIRKKRERTQINKIRNERGEITTNATDIQKCMRIVQMILFQKLDNLEEMDQFQETYSLPTLNKELIN